MDDCEALKYKLNNKISTLDKPKEPKFQFWLRLSEKILKNLRGTHGDVEVVVFGTLYLR